MANEPPAASLQGGSQVEILGVDLDGRQFVEQTRTLTITRDGASIPLANKLAPESEVILRNPLTNEEAVARVVDLIQEIAPVHVYGVAFVDPSANLWQVNFPEPKPHKSILMECTRCQAVDAVLLSEIELEILQSKQTLSRNCACSNASTIWKQPDREVAERTIAEPEFSELQRKIPPVKEQAAQTPQERRKEKRTPMNVPACIRCFGGEVVVECEDVSRGGFRFKSRKPYPAGTRIEAAVPYVKDGMNIFLTAQIAHQQELAGGFYRHGVAYVKTIKSPDSKS